MKILQKSPDQLHVQMSLRRHLVNPLQQDRIHQVSHQAATIYHINKLQSIKLGIRIQIFLYLSPSLIRLMPAIRKNKSL